MDVTQQDRISAVLDFTARLRPSWDPGYAARLLEVFAPDPANGSTRCPAVNGPPLGVVLALVP